MENYSVSSFLNDIPTFVKRTWHVGIKSSLQVLSVMELRVGLAQQRPPLGQLLALRSYPTTARGQHCLGTAVGIQDRVYPSLVEKGPLLPDCPFYIIMFPNRAKKSFGILCTPSTGFRDCEVPDSFLTNG